MIGSWDIVQGNINSVGEHGTDGGLVLSSEYSYIDIRTGSSGDTYKIRIGDISNNETYGIRIYDAQRENIIFDAGEQGNKIAGWNFTDTEISSSTVSLESEKQRINLGTGSSYDNSSILLSGSGEGWLANKQVSWDTSGNVNFGTDVVLSLGTQGGFQKNNIMPIGMTYHSHSMENAPSTDPGGLTLDKVSGVDSLNGQPHSSSINYHPDPFGNTSLVWECWPGSGSSAGGWNSLNFDVDNAFTYMYTIYIKKVGDRTNGSTYWGTRGLNSGGSTGGGVEYIQSSNETSYSLSTNPYFFSGDLPQADKWYLLVGFFVTIWMWMVIK